MRFKCQMLVGNVLVQDAYLEVRFVVNQKAQSRFHSSITIDKRFDSVNHPVVGDATPRCRSQPTVVCLDGFRQ